MDEKTDDDKIINDISGEVRGIVFKLDNLKKYDTGGEAMRTALNLLTAVHNMLLKNLGGSRPVEKKPDKND